VRAANKDLKLFYYILIECEYMKLERKYLDWGFWQEKTIEYTIQDGIEPSKEAKLKAMGSILAGAALCATVIPVIYHLHKRRNPETVKKMKENIHNSLLEKGYSSEQISF
jgi:hypothetical protein